MHTRVNMLCVQLCQKENRVDYVTVGLRYTSAESCRVISVSLYMIILLYITYYDNFVIHIKCII